MKKLMYLLLAMPLLFCACGDDDDTDYLISVFEENLDGYSKNYVNEERDKSELRAYKRKLEAAIQKGDKDEVKYLEDRIQYHEKSQESSKNSKVEYYALLVDKFPKLVDDVEEYAYKRYDFTLPGSSTSKIEIENLRASMIERIRKGEY